MKIRTGFVSNSSSSSFLIWGTLVDRSACYRSMDDEDEDWIYNCKLGHMPEGDDYVYFGRCPSTGKDDETFTQFKLRTETEVKKVLAQHKIETDKLVFGWQKATWYS